MDTNQAARASRSAKDKDDLTAQSVQNRLATLEAEVARLRLLVEKQQPHAWQKIVGAFRGDPYYEEAMKEGRKYRESTRPRERKPKKRANGRS